MSFNDALKVLSIGWWFPPDCKPPGYAGSVLTLDGLSILSIGERYVLIRELALISPSQAASLTAREIRSRFTQDTPQIRNSLLWNSLKNPFLPRFCDEFEVLFREKCEFGCNALVMGNCGGAAYERLRGFPEKYRDMVLVVFPDDRSGIIPNYADIGVEAVPRSQALDVLLERADCRTLKIATQR